MQENATALGALLITISELCDTAEAHGIIKTPPPGVLNPLIDEAKRLGITFDTTPSLEELHLAVEQAAQDAANDQ